jgi:DNA-binding transcriptional LysR family regulator
MSNGTGPEINFLRALEVFVAVADTGSMTSAGRVLRMTQSAISQQIHNLEDSIGAPLIDRHLRPLRLTVAGSMLLDRARRLLLEAKDMQSAIRSTLAVPIPQLRLGALGSIVGSLVPPLVFALLDRMPIKSVSVWSGFASDHQRALLNRDLDLIIIADPLYEVTGLERHELFSEPFIILVPPFVAASKVTLPLLSKSLPLIRHSMRSPVGLKIEQHLRRLRLAPPLYVEFDSIESIVASVSLGKGWAISAPTLLLQGIRDTGRIGVYPLPAPGLRRSFALISRSDELGSVPAEIAKLARKIVLDDLLPRIETFAPFTRGQFNIDTA